MKFIILFIVFLVKFCESNDLKCGRSDNLVESVEFYCESYEEVLPENCTTTFLQWIGTCDKSKVTQLKIGGCDPDKVVQLVSDFMNIRSLDISHSGYESLDAFDLKHQQLVKVNASHNRLTKIPIKFFSNILNVVEVDFSFNELSKHTDIELPHHLIVVRLSHNHISSAEFCSQLSELEYLDLRNNQITSLNESTITTTTLKTLQLQNNQIQHFECAFFIFIEEGASVYIDWENVEHFTSECMRLPFDVVLGSKDEGFLHTTDGKIEMHCNTSTFESIRSFGINNDHFENVAKSMQCLTPTLRKLVLSDTVVEKLDSKFFQRFYNLEYLHLRHAQLEEFDFTWLKHQKNLRALVLSYNNLTKVYNVPFLKSFEELTSIRLEKNLLENAQEVIQHLKPSIKYLYLTGNHVGSVNDTTFEKLKNLEVLGLDDTELSFVDASPFETLKALKYLHIGFNNIETLDLNTLPGELLYNLHLRGNNLTKLDNLTPSRFPRLKMMAISENLFSCEYLKTFVPKVKRDFPGLSMGDPWTQKHGQNCNPEDN
ncbi:chaoptin-like [Contarinia nasturtii]|uniref:chaoptin-like n=1 Tax=Contarinia nasturtii TaxID=265458 RepID=UPI0012D4A3BC|nr:chaoptin-like [Contarinia nasturtii]